MRNTDSTWQISNEAYFDFSSSVLSPEEKDQISIIEDQSAHCRVVQRSSILSDNESKKDDVEDCTRRRWTTPMGELSIQSAIKTKVFEYLQQHKSKSYKF